MKISCAIGAFFFFMATAHAQQFMGGGGGQFMNPGYTGEQQDASSLINCQCAIQTNKGTVPANSVCANFGRNYEKAVIGAGTMTGGVAPGTPSNHVGPY